MKFLAAVSAWALMASARAAVEGVGNPYQHRGLQSDFVDVVITLRDEARVPDFAERLESFYDADVRFVFHRTQAVSARIQAANLALLNQDADVVVVEADIPMKSFAEDIPWGVSAVLQTTNDNHIPPASTSTGECFKICIVDSGLFVDHPDIPYQSNGANIEGREFGIPPDQKWHRPAPTNRHGTHVTGTILAERNNNLGVAGVIGDNSNICLAFARVFPDETDTNMASFIEEAVEWCAAVGSRVINLSLGGMEPTENSRRLYQNLVSEDGVMIVAASGNLGGSELLFPASFSNVVSVGSVEQNLQWASFSQFNEQLDLVAPGVSIRSTVPDSRAIDNRGFNYPVSVMQYSPIPSSAQVNAPVVDCGLGTSICSNAQGKICVIERGSNSFTEKVLNCQSGGGVGAVVYNTAANMVVGTLGGPGVVAIPAVGMVRSHGLELMKASTVNLRLLDATYGSFTGTSMSAPHVTGVAAKIWAARPECTQLQVREALERTARDLGPPGRDDKYGHGIPQAAEAYDYLLQQPAPCGVAGTSVNTGSGRSDDVENKRTKLYQDVARGNLTRRQRRRNRVLRGSRS